MNKLFHGGATVVLALLFVYFIGLCVRGGFSATAAEVDENAKATLLSLQQADVAAGLSEVYGIRDSREASREEIRRSAAASEAESRAAESRAVASSIYASIEESIYESIENSMEEERKASLFRAAISRGAEDISREESWLAAEREAEYLWWIGESIAESSRQEVILESIRASEAEESRRAAEEASRQAAAETTRQQTAPGNNSGKVVFFGDSRTAGFYDYGILPKSQCYYYGGACYYYVHYDNARAAAATHPAKIVFMCGQNDLGVYHGDASRFIAEYTNLIRTFASLSPSTVIYVNLLIPDTPAATAAMPGREKVGEYNSAIRSMCAQNGWNCIDASAGFNSSYYSGDGIHFLSSWYPIWFQNFRNLVGF